MSFSFPRKLIFRVLTLVLKISRIGCNWLKPREGGTVCREKHGRQRKPRKGIPGCREKHGKQRKSRKGIT